MKVNNDWNTQVSMPEASKPNIHGYIHGRIAVAVFNTGGVEENQYATPSPFHIRFIFRSTKMAEQAWSPVKKEIRNVKIINSTRSGVDK